MPTPLMPNEARKWMGKAAAQREEDATVGLAGHHLCAQEKLK